jgi:hypothetical protein
VESRRWKVEGNVVTTKTNPTQQVSDKSGPAHASHFVIFGIGVLGMIWMATTSFAPVVIALLVAAVIYQGIHKGATASFFSWLD